MNTQEEWNLILALRDKLEELDLQKEVIQREIYQHESKIVNFEPDAATIIGDQVLIVVNSELQAFPIRKD